ncbi:hypothetical protein AgCh_013391 [Apium graveolens]
MFGMGLTGQPSHKRITLVVEPTRVSPGKRYYRELRRRQALESGRMHGHAMNVNQEVPNLVHVHKNSLFIRLSFLDISMQYDIIKTLFIDHACVYSNGVRAPPPVNSPLSGPVPKAGVFPPLGGHDVSRGIQVAGSINERRSSMDTRRQIDRYSDVVIQVTFLNLKGGHRGRAEPSPAEGSARPHALACGLLGLGRATTEANCGRLGSATEAPGWTKGFNLWASRPGALKRKIVAVMTLLRRLLVGQKASIFGLVGREHYRGKL